MMRRAWVGFLAVAAITACESNPDVSWAPGGGGGPTAAPGAPAGLVTTPANGAVELEWLPNGASDGVTSYVVYSAAVEWSTWTPALPSAVRTEAIACCEHTVTSLENDRPYWFAVAAVNPIAESVIPSPSKEVPPGWPGLIHVGTSASDLASGIAVDPAGNIYVSGDTLGAFPGFTNASGVDAFVFKMAPDGEVLWVQQRELAGVQVTYDIAVNSAGDVFVVGRDTTTSFFSFLWSLDTDGGFRFYEAFGDGFNLWPKGVAVVGTSAMVTGSTEGSFFGGTAGGTDAFFAVFNGDGTVSWGRQWGTAAADYGQAIAPSLDGGYYITGDTYGSLPGETNQGSGDIFVVKYDDTGLQDWLDQGGTTNIDEARDVVGFGASVYLAGQSGGTMFSAPNQGGQDAVLWAHEADGDHEYGKLRGTPGDDVLSSIAVQGTGLIYVAGTTPGIQSTSILLMQFDQSDPFTAEGNQVWAATIPSQLYPADNFGGMAISERAVFVVGSDSYDVFVLKVDSLGNLQ